MICQTFIALLMMLAAPAFAQEEGSSTFPKPEKPESRAEWRTHVGVLAGYNNADGSDYKSTLGYGIDIGLQPYIPYGLGAELATAAEGDLTRTTLLGRAAYNFGGSNFLISRSYVGAILGPVWDTDSAFDGVHFGIGPVLGFDIPFKEITEKTVSLGLNAKYLFVNDGSPDSLALNGLVKYWF